MFDQQEKDKSKERERVKEPKQRVNWMIRVPKVRVIDPNGQQLGIMNTKEAIDKALNEYDLDLIEISPNASPPVCKIMDFGKFKYQQKKKNQEAKRNQNVIIVKEIKMRPTTDQHDFDFKVKHIERFLADGNKVKVTIKFRGREVMHANYGQAMMERIAKALENKVSIEQQPKLEGKNMIMVLGPAPNK